MRDLQGKLVVITGAGSGIGFATAQAFAHAGSRLAVCDVDELGLAAAKAELGSSCVLARKVDVSDRAAMRAFSEEVHQLAPAADVVVNNAGVAYAGGILDTPLEQWDWLLGINLGGVIHGCHFFAPAMVKRGQGGHIVNVSSAFGLYAAPRITAYVTSKFAVLGLSQSLRTELAPAGIGVTAICPGLIATKIAERSRAPSQQAAAMERAVELFRRRGAPPSRVADAILASVRRDRGVVPVSPEAWLVWGLSRAAPGLLDRLGDRMLRKLSGEPS